MKEVNDYNISGHRMSGCKRRGEPQQHSYHDDQEDYHSKIKLMIGAVEKSQPQLHYIAVTLLWIRIGTLFCHFSEPSRSILDLIEHFSEHFSESIYILTGVSRSEGIFLVKSHIYQFEILYILCEDDRLRTYGRMDKVIALDIFYGIDQLMGDLIEMI